MLSIDLNCDMGEGMPHDAALMRLITSANIACGGHAGDADTMHRSIELALMNNVAIGAHPSYPDKENFGRKDLLEKKYRHQDIAGFIIEQLDAFATICKRAGADIHHVKPHGALYNRAAWDGMAAEAICSAIKTCAPSIRFFYGLSGSVMKKQAELHKLEFVSEVFADRGYDDEAKLVPRDQPGALIEDEASSIQQVIQMIEERIVTSVNAKRVSINAETICIHGDGVNATVFAKNIRETILRKQIKLSAP
jgi:5-oxoprolinase (ATP-hydrolysing) subunit A